MLLGGALLLAGMLAAVAVREFGDADAAAEGLDEPEAVPVIVDVVGTHGFADRVEAIGTVRARDSVTLTSSVADTVEAVRFESGQRVVAGDVLVTLADAEERAALAEARASLAEARRENERLDELAGQGAVPRSELDRSRSALERNEARVVAAEAQLADRTVRAPFAGTVGLRTLSPGAWVGPGDGLVSLDDLSVVELDFAVPERFLPSVAVGQRVRAVATAYPDTTFAGEIRAIDARVDAASRAFTVRATLPNADERLRPGMLLDVTLRRSPRQAPAVPEIAVVRNGTVASVYRVEDARATRREIELGARDGRFVEVLDGLATGDEIVVEGVQRLDEGTRVDVRAPAADS